MLLAADINAEAIVQSRKQTGDELFSTLFDRHVQLLFNYGMHACKDQELVMSCLQELFVRVWHQRNALAISTSVKSYLFRTFRNLLIENIRTQGESSSFFAISYQTTADNQVLPGSAFTNFDCRNGRTPMDQLAQQLIGPQREAVFLKFNYGLSYNEVASIMGISPKSVHIRVSSVVDALHQQVKNELQNGTDEEIACKRDEARLNH